MIMDDWDSTVNGKPAPKPVFCKTCGKRLVPNGRVTGYDEYTGTAIRPYLDQLICPDNLCGYADAW